MQALQFQHKNLSALEVHSSRQHRLHPVKLFSAALCHITQGSKVIIQGESAITAAPGQLIILPGGAPLEIINRPQNGAFRSDLLLLPADLLAEFKTDYIHSYTPGRLSSLCVPLSRDLAFMWDNLLQAVRTGLSPVLQKHLAMGVLMALHQEGMAGPLLIERTFNLTEQVKQILLLSPARLWSAQYVASQLSIGVSTLRRRLQQESQSFRTIVEEVRMSYALSQLQSTTLPIGEIAAQCGYLSSSRFTARFREYYGCLPKSVR